MGGATVSADRPSPLSMDARTMDRPARILVVDDDPTFRDVLELRLQRWGYVVKTADRADKGVELARNWDPDLVLSDVVMPEMSGIQLLEKLRANHPDRTVILLTAHATVEMAVDAMKLGAVDFLTKPLNYQNLEALISDALARRRSDAADRTPASPSTPDRTSTTSSRKAGDSSSPTEGDGLGPFLGASPAMREVYEQLRSVADSHASVLITGESGTGKELAARTIHELSPRAEEAFVAVNAAAIPRELMESEIFGHEKGAFTGASETRAGCFEMADRGTLFLDEIGEMPMELQPKLLRVLDHARLRRVGGKEELSFDVRTLSATNRDPREAVEEGVLREDLYFRLNVLSIHLPPLRERTGDVKLLAARFASEFSTRHGGPERALESEALEAMEAYDWPGNVRELRNLVERAVVLARDGRIGAEHLPPYVRDPVPRGENGDSDFAFPHGATAADVERELILLTLDRTGNNKAEAARRLGVSVRTIRNKLNSWGIDL
ncbi:MAG: sigma-54-dependent Fis family transcriptional regulator [Gemmatimonadales bacterium]|nr:MAG: sigma-54-dependent Fis family transcriptional regulator [Gemmatimonadales bacterium]